jgi:hypothetical protein
MDTLGSIHCARNEHEQGVEWFTKGAEAGLPGAMSRLGCCLDWGKGVAAPDYPAAVDWYRRAASAGDPSAAVNLSHMYAVGRGRALSDNAWIDSIDSIDNTVRYRAHEGTMDSTDSAWIVPSCPLVSTSPSCLE